MPLIAACSEEKAASLHAPSHDEVASKMTHETAAKKPCLSHTTPSLGGIVIALCCHHRCNWGHYTGRKALSELGFTPVEFHLLCLMSSWAVCGIRPHFHLDSSTGKDVATKPDPHPSGEQAGDAATKPDHDPSRKQDGIHSGQYPEKSAAVSTSSVTSISSHDHESERSHSYGSTGYVPHPKESIGLKCKRLLDYGRLVYVQRECGLAAKLAYYVDRETSLENVLLIVSPCI